MTADSESRLTITTEHVPVSCLGQGDLVHIAFPAPQYRVVTNESRKGRFVRNRRSEVTLVDSDGIAKTFRWSPNRQVSRVTNPEIPVGPWRFGLFRQPRLTEMELRRWEQEDALWYKILSPLGKPFAWLWRKCRDLPSRVSLLKLHAGFLGVLTALLIVAIALAARLPPEQSVAISILGAFIVEPCWQAWRGQVRRNLAEGTSIRVSYESHGSDKMRYGTLQLRKKSALILSDQAKSWRSTEVRLHRRGVRVATFVFANDIRGDTTYTCSRIADAIRHRISDGSDRVIHATSTRYDPASEKLTDIQLVPMKRHFHFSFRDEDTPDRGFTVYLKFYQARLLAEVLEVMDDGRRL